MGQKTHPKGFRLGILESWDSTWYADPKGFGTYLVEDIRIRKFLDKELASAQCSRVHIQRYVGKLIINCYVTRLGIAVGKGGARRDELKAKLARMVKTAKDIHIDFFEETKPDLSAEVVMQNVAQQIEKRVNFRRVLRQTMKRCQQAGAKGVKLMVSGRLNGAEMSRTEWQIKGRIPLHTLRAKIDYSQGVARTIYGAIGVKVWIYTGDVIPRRARKEAA
ncbi:30S ribosomal protein S3 [bacterium]|nr:30S ribosomal protein S3 [bacterium]